MKVYHRTFHAAAIIREGFRDATGKYLADQDFSGVWVSDRPLDMNDGADGDAVLALEIPVELFAAHEWIEDGKPYRESLMPAAILNRFGPPEIVEESSHPLNLPDVDEEGCPKRPPGH